MGHSVGFIDDPRFDLHDQGPGHPERPARLTAIREGIENANLLKRVEHTGAVPTTMDIIATLHDPKYVRLAKSTCAHGGLLGDDTHVIPPSWDAALHAAGSAMHAATQVMTGTWQRAFCAIRPPGHHALFNRAMGFCVFGNIVLAARAAIQAGAQRVAIIDWDVHHGNGTQDMVWDDPNIMFASLHQYPFYPGTGSITETGGPHAPNTIVNCPIAAYEGDDAYLHAWHTRIKPAFERFSPNIVLISAGFDAEARDPLGQLQITPAGFEALSSEVVAFANQACGGRIVSLLEGGYSLAALRETVPLHLATLID